MNQVGPSSRCNFCLHFLNSRVVHQEHNPMRRQSEQKMKAAPRGTERGGQTMARKYFGTDGIRGSANSYPMTSEVAMRVGMAAPASCSPMAPTATAW